MLTSDQAFGALRALLAGAPEAWRWTQLCAMLDAWPDERALEHEVLPYVEGHLRAWPDALRVAPLFWTRLASFGQPLPRLRIVRALQLERDHWTVERLRNLADHPHLPSLQKLALLGGSIAWTGLAALLTAPCCVRLRVLHLGGHEGESARFHESTLGEHALTSLESLTVEHGVLPARTVGSFVARCPNLHTLRLRDDRMGHAGVETLARAPLPNLHTLELRLDPVVTLQPLALARWSSVRDLRVWKCGDAQVRALREMPWLQAPEALALEINDRDDVFTKLELVQAHQETLRDLSLLINAYGEALSERWSAGVARLNLSRLERLVLRGWAPSLDAQSLERLVPPTLRDLSCSLLVSEGVSLAPIADHPSLQHLTLRMRGRHAFADVERLCAGSASRRLRVLSLKAGHLNHRAAYALRDATLPELRCLDLSSNHIGTAGFEALTRASWFDGLRELRVRNSGIGGAAGVRALVARPRPCLLAIDLSEQRITDEDARTLASTTALPALRALHLMKTRIGPAGMSALFSSPHLPDLEVLRVSGDAFQNPQLGTLFDQPPRRGMIEAGGDWGVMSEAAVRDLRVNHEGSPWLEAHLVRPSLHHARHEPPPRQW